MIRPLHARDRGPVLTLLRDTRSFSAAEIAVAEELIDTVLGRPAQTDYIAWVKTTAADATSSVAGFVLFGPTPATAATWDLYWIAVRPDLQGTGAAQELEQRTADFVKDRGGCWLLAETSGRPDYGRSRAFYRKRGYAELSRIPDYYAPGDDLVVFGKRMDAAAADDADDAR